MGNQPLTKYWIEFGRAGGEDGDSSAMARVCGVWYPPVGGGAR